MATTIALPADVGTLSGLVPIDYEESFAISIDSAMTPEQWARLSLEQAPGWMRAVMVNGWPRLGIHLAPFGSGDAVLGWPILHRDSSAIVIGVEASIGITARIVIQTRPGRAVHSMVVRYDKPSGRLAWTRIAPPHRIFVRHLLDVAARTSSRRNL